MVRGVMKEKLVCMGVTHGALAGETLPAVLTVLKWGDNKTDRGTFRLTERSLAAIQAQRDGGLFDSVLIDFEHNSCRTHPNYQPPPRKHAGVGMVFGDAERGLGIEQAKWTPHGVEFARDYPDLSPVLRFDQDTMEVLGLQSVALVPNGGVVGLSFFEAAAMPTQGVPTMDQDVMDRFSAIEAALATMKKFIDELMGDKPEAVVEMAAGLRGLIGVTAFDPTPLNAKIGTLETTIVALQADLVRRDRTAIVDRAAREGKVIALSAEAMEKLSIADLEAHVKQVPVTVPLERRTPVIEVSLGAQAPSSNLSRIAAMCGIDPAEVAKANAQ